MNDKPILYEDKIKDRDNDFLYNKCVNQYHQLMNCQYKNKEYKNKINNLQSKIDNFNLFKIFLQERLLELKDNIERGINDFDAKDECEYILDKFTYFLKEDK